MFIENKVNGGTYDPEGVAHKLVLHISAEADINIQSLQDLKKQLGKKSTNFKNKHSLKWT